MAFVYPYIILPILIFLARITDVTVGTLRILFISKGYRFIAPLLGFIEVLIWITAMKEIMQNLSNVVTYIAYAGGFAMGNFIGMIVENKLSLGLVAVRVITDNATEIAQALDKKNYGITVLEGEGNEGKKVKIIFSILNRKHLDDVLGIIKEYNPMAFYSVEDIRTVSDTGIFPLQQSRREKLFKMFRPHRKGK